jgi:Methyltransferase FkbM domain
VSFSEADDGVYSAISELAGKDAHRARRSGSREYKVDTISLSDLLDEHGITKLDFLSIDTEGSEFEILKNFDFPKYQPTVIAVEHNYTDHRSKLYDLISQHGYVRVFEEYSAFDDWYVLRDIVEQHR